MATSVISRRAPAFGKEKELWSPLGHSLGPRALISSTSAELHSLEKWVSKARAACYATHGVSEVTGDHFEV